MSKVLKAAFAYADHPDQGGASYYLRVHLSTGAQIVGDVQAWKEGDVLRLVLEANDGGNLMAFIEPAEVMAAIIVFL